MKNRCEGIIVFGISGCSRSGKSCLSFGLQKKLVEKKIGVKIIHQDRFFKKESEKPDCINWKKFVEEIKKSMKSISCKNCRVLNHDKCTRKRANSVIILEGFLLFSKKSVQNLCDLKIFMKISFDLAFTRRRYKNLKRPNFEKIIWNPFLKYGDYERSVDNIFVIDAENLTKTEVVEYFVSNILDDNIFK